MGMKDELATVELEVIGKGRDAKRERAALAEPGSRARRRLDEGEAVTRAISKF